MKYLLSILVMSALCMFSCKDAPERPDPMLDENYQPAQTTTTNTNTITPSSTTTSGGTVYHYVCPNNCGGGDAQGNCPVCGSAFIHNQEFHNQAQNATANTATPTPGNNTITPPTQTPEPPQNAAGVWHYTCANGCEGGAGSAIACASCGSTLVHNTLYHQ